MKIKYNVPLFKLLCELGQYDELKNFINTVDEIGEIRVKRTGVGEYDITIKGKYWVTNILDYTTRVVEDTIIYNTSTGLVCWTTGKQKYEQ